LAGLLFWWPVVQCLETRSFRWPVVLYLFLATLPCDILAAFLAFSNRTVYLSYVGATQLFSMSPLEDQQCAGALMWVWITFAYLIPAVAITMQILSPLSAQSHKSVETPWRGLPARPLNGSGAESL
jgi:cytochrome c oxidase assembly factor CtaG